MDARGALLLCTAVVAVLLSPVVVAAASGNLSDEVAALMAVKAALRDPGHVLGDWLPVTSGGDNPCNWSVVYCHRGQLYKLNLKRKNLTGELSPAIGRLTSLRFLILSHNAISGPIPDTVGGMPLLERIDLSSNQFNGSIPSTLGGLMKLRWLELNNNKLSGPIPESLTTAPKIFRLDLSYNNLSGPRPTVFHASVVTLQGNPLLSGINCVKGETDPLSRGNCSYVPGAQQDDHPPANEGYTKEEIYWCLLSILLLFIACVLFVALLITGLWLLHRRRHQLPHQVFAVVDDAPSSAISENSLGNHLGHLKQYRLGQIKKATHNFSRGNILGEGAFGIVYKGIFPDGTIAAVKRLKGRVSAIGDDQFNTEVEVISLVAHHNLLHLIGFCTADDERILVYPYMPNGTVASKLQEQVDGAPALDWPRRRMIALGAAQGLCYLHEQCDPKIIHRDIKASNILLDEYLEAVVADFGLAKLVDHGVSHIVTVVRGTIGRIPPEAVLVGHSSEKTDIFGFGLLLIEMITGRRTLELHENEYEDGGILEMAKDLLKKNRLSTFVDRRLRNNYDSFELEELVQIALLCTMYSPQNRPSMSEVVRMLEGGDAVAERWEALKDVVEQTTSPSPELMVRTICCDDSAQHSVVQQGIELSGPR